MMVKMAAMRSCVDKRRYADQGEAMRFAVSRPGRKPGDAIWRAYPCRVCSGWHLTSKALSEAVEPPRSVLPPGRSKVAENPGKAKARPIRKAAGAKNPKRATVL